MNIKITYGDNIINYKLNSTGNFYTWKLVDDLYNITLFQLDDLASPNHNWSRFILNIPTVDIQPGIYNYTIYEMGSKGDLDINNSIGVADYGTMDYKIISDFVAVGTQSSAELVRLWRENS